MCNKTLLVSRLLSIFICFHILTVCLADDPNTAADTYDWAEIYFKSQNYKRAEELYQKLLDTWPDDPYYAVRGQAGLAKSSVAFGNIQAADAAVEKLLADYSDNEHLPTCLCNVAYYYQFFQQYQKAGNLYRFIVNNHPQARYAMWSRIGLAQVDDLLGNIQAAESAIANILSDYSQHEDMPAAICNMAQHYCDVRNYDKARYYYQYVIDTWPEHEYAMWSRQGLAELNAAEPNDTPEELAEIVTQINLAKSKIGQADPNAAQAVFDELLNNYSGHPRLPEAIYEIARHCLRSGKHQEASRLYQCVIDNWPEHPKALWSQIGLAESYLGLGNTQAAANINTNHIFAAFSDNDLVTPLAVHDIGYICLQLGRYEQAIQYFQKILNDWPDCEHASEALFLMARCYKKLEHSPSAPNEHGEMKIQEAYNAIVENYPESPYAEMILLIRQRRLITSKISQGDDATAYAALDQLLADFRESKELPKTLALIAIAYYDRALQTKDETYFSQAINIWKRIIAEFPDAPCTVGVYRYIAICYRHLGEYEKAKQYLQEESRDYPNNQYIQDEHCSSCPD